MKNKLLVSVFAVGIAVLAFTSCETKSDVTGVCTDMIKTTLHKSARGLEQQEGQKLTISEFEFPGGVNDNRLIYRTISFGNEVNEAKKVDTMTYQYGEWSENGTVFSLLVTPTTGDPFTLLYKGNSFITPDKREFGGTGLDNTARVEKWERVIASFPDYEWAGMFEGDYVLDSVFRDSITFVPFPRPGRYDTIPWFDHMDTVSADTTCYMEYSFYRNPATFANTGHYYQRSVRSKYDRETKTIDTLSVVVKEYDYTWFFSEVSSDAKFNIEIVNTTPGVEAQKLNISKYKLDDAGVPVEFLLGGLTFERLIPVPVP